MENNNWFKLGGYSDISVDDRCFINYSNEKCSKNCGYGLRSRNKANALNKCRNHSICKKYTNNNKKCTDFDTNK